MKEIIITANDAGRRLDRFLRKYLRNASLSEIYKIIRKDVKVDGRRMDQSYVLNEGDTLSLYIADDVLAKMTGADRPRGGSAGTRADGRRPKKQFRVIYEDANILIADKPFGLLTHGDAHEKKNHLANQVRDYLIEQGEYDPREERVFAPAPANRIDRNTTGLVLFGKNSAALKALNEMIREDMIDKYYLTIVHGVISGELTLTGTLIKDEVSNRVTIRREDEDGLDITTVVKPVEVLRYGRGHSATLTEVRLVTGRSHQIRAHLASIGHPVIGDAKYQTSGVRRANEYIADSCHLTTQLLHAHRIEIREAPQVLAYLQGRSFTAPLPQTFTRILESMRSGR